MRTTECGFQGNEGQSGSDHLVTLGPSVLVNIGFDPQFQLGGDTPVPGITEVNALIDTGATESHIDLALAQEIELPKIDVQRNYGGAAGSFRADTYLAQFTFRRSRIPYTESLQPSIWLVEANTTERS